MADRMLRSALAYAQRFGFAVFPLSGKIPFPGTHGFKDATKDPDIIMGMWRRYPGANVGIATGAVSGIDVIDIDPRNGGDKTWNQYGCVIECPTVLTGGGGLHHYLTCQYLSYPKVLGPGVDVKSNSGYVVAPPSVHAESGQMYRWDDDYRLESTPLGELPPIIMQRIAELNNEKKGSYGTAEPTTYELEAATRKLLPHGFQRREQYFHKCPFHEEQDASFNVNFKLGVFHCFGCGESGTVRQLVYRLRYF